MSETESDSQNTPTEANGEGFKLASERPATPARTDMTVAEMRDWLRNWVGNATGQSPDAINDSTPMVELGLSSRDAVAMASDIEDLTGVTLTATVAFRHPTIESLATVIVEGEPEVEFDEDEDWSRTREVDDIAIVGLATRFPGDMNTPEETWQALLEGRSGITDLPEGRWVEFLDEPRIAERVAKARTRGGYLKDIKGFDAEFFALSKMEADNIDPQQRMALELTWEALENARIPASVLRGQSVGRLHRQLHQRLQHAGDVRSVGCAPVCDHGYGELDHRQPGVVLLRLPRAVDRRRHGVLELAGRRAPGRAVAAVG